MNGMWDGVWGERLRKGLFFVVTLLGLFLIVQTVAGFQGLRYIGAGTPPSNTISVTGHGEASGVPDIATFTFTVSSEKTTVAAAQTDATAQVNAITGYLKDAGIDAKDIQTSDYSVYPQYEYQNAVCPAYAPASGSSAIYCPPGKQVLKGYQVRQTTTVKVRDTSKAGDLLTGVGTKGATEVSGLSFTFDEPDTLQTQARADAIADAKKKADELASQLGVRLVRVVSFYENGNNPGPVYYSKDVAFGMGGDAEASVAPEISVGQNKVTSDVSVTYEIR